MAKSPFSAMVGDASGTPPLLVSVTVCGNETEPHAGDRKTHPEERRQRHPRRSQRRFRSALHVCDPVLIRDRQRSRSRSKRRRLEDHADRAARVAGQRVAAGVHRGKVSRASSLRSASAPHRPTFVSVTRWTALDSTERLRGEARARRRKGVGRGKNAVPAQRGRQELSIAVDREGARAVSRGRRREDDCHRASGAGIERCAAGVGGDAKVAAHRRLPIGNLLASRVRDRDVLRPRSSRSPSLSRSGGRAESARSSLPASPLPLSATVACPPATLPKIVIVALRSPVAAGAKRTSRVQLCPTAIGAATQSSVSKNSACGPSGQRRQADRDLADVNGSIAGIGHGHLLDPLAVPTACSQSVSATGASDIAGCAGEAAVNSGICQTPRP